jgi:hypothetical protein
MASAAGYQLSHNTLGVPLAFPTKTGPRCGHYEQVTTPTGHPGLRFVRDPNAVCGLPTKKANVDVCLATPSACSNIPLPAGWSQIGTTPITGRTPSEMYGNVQIR